MPISSVFFAVLHLIEGPKIVCQVPEGLITAPPRSFVSPTSSDLSTNALSPPPSNTNNTLTSISSPPRPPLGRSSSKAQASSTTISSQLSATSTAGGGPASLFEFELISQFTIPQAELCGRLMICTTRKHRIVGFPVILKGTHYEREMFQYNVCFVFQRDLDVSPYEPVVRKVARVLTACEVSEELVCGTVTHRFDIYRKSAGFFQIRRLLRKYTPYSSNSLPISTPSQRHR
jgi:nitrogen permease regulator 2-like protein